MEFDSSIRSESKQNESLHACPIRVDYSGVFTCESPFKTRDELVKWAQKVGKENGFVVIIKHSDKGGNGRRGRVFLACERSGKYRGPKLEKGQDVDVSTLLVQNKKDDKKRKDRSHTSTKKCECPFLLIGKNPEDDVWILNVSCGLHNHDATKCMVGHSLAGRLEEDEIEFMNQLSKGHAKPREILAALKYRNPENCSSRKHIYNERQRQRKKESLGMSQMQHLLHLANAAQYVERHRVFPETNVLQDIFWAHPVSIDLLRCFPHTLFIGCTSKTNKYKYPLLQIIGLTSTDLTFFVAFGYMSDEKEDNFTWILQSLKDLLDGWSLPSVIFTDLDLVLMKAIAKVFPSAINLLCSWHINCNVLASTRHKFSMQEDFDIFVRKWNDLCKSTTESAYYGHLTEFESDYNSLPDVLVYLKTTWLNLHKERFVTAWTNNVLHFGNTTTNRVESAHSRVKSHIRAGKGDFVSCWKSIDADIRAQHRSIKESFERSKLRAGHEFQHPSLLLLQGGVSWKALSEITKEIKLVQEIGVDANSCSCVLRKTHGLPCAHEIAILLQSHSPIPLSDVHSHWSKLSMVPDKDEVSCELPYMVVVEKLIEK